MPRRQSVKTYKSDEVQGEGSSVTVSAVKVREIREIRKHGADPKYDDFEGGVKLLAQHIIKWNWVDDVGEPLPYPKDDPTVIDELTNEESEYLVNLLMKSRDEAKNSTTGS